MSSSTDTKAQEENKNNEDSDNAKGNKASVEETKMEKVLDGKKETEKSPLLTDTKSETKIESKAKGDEANDINDTKPKLEMEEVKNSKEELDKTSKTDVVANSDDKPNEKTPLNGSAMEMFKGLNSRLVFAVISTAFGSAFLHGYNLGVINAPLQLMGDWLEESTYNSTGVEMSEKQNTLIISWIVSVYCIGGMIGGALTGVFSENFGRKGGLLLNNISAIVAAIFFGFSKMAGSYVMLIIARLIIGVNNGLNAGLAPMYLTEIAPANLRGAIGTVYQLVVTISILISQIMGLEGLLGTETLWPLLLALTFVPAVFQLLTMPICPESPKYLLINKELRLDAQRALTWLRNTSNVHEELEEISNEAEAQKLVPKVSMREITMNPALRIPLIISVMMMLAQQFSGINAAIFFSTKIYEQAGLDAYESLYATIAMGIMNVLMTVVSLILVERAGRKTLLLAGLSGMAIDTVLLTICLALQSHAKWLSYASIVLVILFVVMFATGPGSIPWFLVNELFASNARPMASSIAVAVNWTAAFFVGIGFLPIQQALGPYVFLLFTLLLSLFILFTYLKVPETKGRTIDEITSVFKQQAYGEDKGNRV